MKTEKKIKNENEANVTQHLRYRVNQLNADRTANDFLSVICGQNTRFRMSLRSNITKINSPISVSFIFIYRVNSASILTLATEGGPSFLNSSADNNVDKHISFLQKTIDCLIMCTTLNNRKKRKKKQIIDQHKSNELRLR